MCCYCQIQQKALKFFRVVLARHHDIQHNDNLFNDTQHYDNLLNDTQYNDTQHDDTQLNDIQHDIKLYMTLSITTLDVLLC